jgi:excisionase family DNA binding protein
MQTVSAQSEIAPRTRRIVGAKPVAELLGVKPPRVYDLAQQNLIPHIKLGRQVRFDLDKVEAWLESGGQALPGGWRQEAA